MARLAAITKLLHYPTPISVMELIASCVPITSDFGKKAILDPCASDGSAALVLGKAWNCAVHGVELSLERAAQLAQNVDIGLHGSYAQLAVDDGAKYSVLFLNPPYDYARLNEDTVERQELQFLMHCTQFLQPGGLLVLIPPASLLKREDFRSYLAKKYTNVRCWRFPNKEFAAFSQVVIIANKVSNSYACYGRERDFTGIFAIETMPVLGTQSLAQQYLCGTVHDEINPTIGEVDPADISPSYEDEEGVWGSRQWHLMTKHGLGADNAPLIEPRAGHQAMLLAAGALNGCQVGDSLVKGGSDKKMEIRAAPDGSETHTERIVSHLSMLSLTTGQFDTWNVVDEPTKTAEWFTKHKGELARAIRASHTPSFNGDCSQWQSAVSALTPPGVLPGHEEPCWLDGQISAACALVHRWKDHKNVILSGEMGCGKCMPVSHPVLTPDGWRAHGDLKVGDLVMDPDTGGTTEVIGVYPRGVLQQYRVTFSDGTSTECGGDHLWEVNTPLRKWRGKQPRVLSTEDILNKYPLRHANGNLQQFIPMTVPPEHPEADLPIAPYTLGAMLGDGGFGCTPRVLSETKAAPNYAANDPCTCTLTYPGQGNNPLAEAVHELGLDAHRSWEKFIPDQYLTASVDQRVALLRGLMDTDGGVAPGSNTVEYSTTSGRLVEGVQALVESLGGTVTVRYSTFGGGYKGEKLAGRPSWRVHVKVPAPLNPFHLKRKADAYEPRTKYNPTRAIVSIEPAGTDECVCIKVANPRGLYITNNYIVTHNTSIATIAADLSKWNKVVVMCPGHLVTKWVREIQVIVGSECAMSAQVLSDVDAFFADPTMRFLVVSKERAKLGARWASVAWKHKKVFKGFHRPTWDRGRYTEGRSYYVCKEVDACPRCDEPVDDLPPRKKVKCEKCGDQLWESRPISKSTKTKPNGTRRWALATHIAKKYARRYSLIVDECHQYAGGTTDQSRAVQKLLTSAQKTLMMTGTLYGGRATSIFHILYKCEPGFRSLYEFTEAKRFAEHHGLFERSYSEEETHSRSGYRRGNTGGRIREIPGMSPAMIPMLLPYTVFVKLADFEVDLPEYSEELVMVDPDPDVQAAASAMAQSCLAVLREYPQALGAYLQACLGYPDRADQSETIEAIIRDEAGEEVDRIVVANAPALPTATYPKDDYVVKLATQEKAAGRGVLVYTTQNKRRDVRGRLKTRLEAAGLRVVVLDSNVAPDKREDWIRKEKKQGFDVMITNGKLVETGLDLMWAHTIVQYGIEYSIHTLRQTLRRSWRLGQNLPIRVHILAQKGTMQEHATNLIASKMRASEMVDGDEAGGLAQVSTTGSNFLVELAQSALMGQ